MDTNPLFASTPNPMKKPSSRSGSDSNKYAESSNAARLLILQNMVPIATNLVASQLEAFSSRLSEELFKLSDQAIRPEDAKLSFEAHQLVKRNGTSFYRLVASQITAALAKEVSVFNTKKRTRKEDMILDGTAQSYEEIESKILLRNASQALEVISAEPLVLLNTLIGRVLNRTPIDVSQNPFRPEIFLNAVHKAWMELDPHSGSHIVVLRLLQPHVFLQLTPILDEINHELMARGVRPDAELTLESTLGVHGFLPGISNSGQDPYLQKKLKKIFAGEITLEALPATLDLAAMMDSSPSEELDDTLDNHERDESMGINIDRESIDKQFFEDLLKMQKNYLQYESIPLHYEPTLRKLMKTRSASELNLVERNIVELLARIFDFIFMDQALQDDVKNVIGQLQIPILRVALRDTDFFLRESHPARTLVDILGSSGLVLDPDGVHEDPLLGVIGDVVERVQIEFDEQIDLFSNVVADLESFLKDEELRTQEAISEPVQNALSAEKMRISRECAEHDVAIRVETGEVAGFLEEFLREHWIRILTIAHSVKDEKPHALENALKTMDDLIWSLKPKNSAEERKELIAKLPSMLTLLNAWLNAIRWDDPDRVLFFSKLAERHAAIARAPLELSPRRQLEIAVNIAQRASNRRLDRFVFDKVTNEDDEATKQVVALERGAWLDFSDVNEQVSRFKLAWISPKRTSFIFTNRQGSDAFSISAEDLISRYRENTIHPILANSLVDRAMTFALRDLPV